MHYFGFSLHNTVYSELTSHHWIGVIYQIMNVINHSVIYYFNPIGMNFSESEHKMDRF